MLNSLNRTHGAIAAVSITTLLANAGAPTHSWLNPVSGDWSLATNWSAGSVPSFMSSVELGLSGAYSVESAFVSSAMTLDISNPSAILNVNNAHTLDLFGNLSNMGLITINPLSSGSSTQVDFEENALISGSGTIQLSAFASRARLRSGAGVTVTHGSSHTIRGFGQIEASLDNQGTIEADSIGNELFLLSNPKGNNGLIRASNGGQLDITSIAINQTAAGVIEAVGAGSVVELNAATINGGILRTDAVGVISSNNATLDGVTFNGETLNLENARTLDVFNSLHNDGTITVNPLSLGSATQLDFESSGSFTGSGEVVLNSFATRARLRTGAGVTMTNASTHTIRGYGQIEAALINDGLVSADVATQELFFLVENKVNNATMQAVNDGVIDFGSVSVDQSGGGQIVADGGLSRVDFNSSSVIGGQVRAINGATVSIQNSTFDGVATEGDLRVENARTLDVFNSITNNGTITVNPNSSGSATQIDFENNGAFLGNGEVVLNSFATRARLRTGVGVSMTNSVNHTIRGYGQIEAALINNGLVSADAAGQELFLLNEDKVNNATIEAVNDGVADFGFLTVDQSGGGLMIADGPSSRVDLNTTTIIGGTVRTINNAILNIDTATVVGTTLDADARVLNARSLRVEGGVMNNGTITVNSIGGGSATSLIWGDDTELGGSGIINLNAIGTRAQITLASGATMATLGQNQRLVGIGSIDAPLTHNGTTAPGMSIGTMTASQPVTFTDNSVFEAEVNTTTADLLDSTSSIVIDGTLEVIFVDGFAPSGYWARKIMEGNGITGKFDAVVVPAPASGFVTRVYNDGNNLFVGQTCPSDTNLDGALNFFDVSVFLSNYNAGNLAADLNGDGILNFFDVSVFLSSYNMGC